MTHTSVSTGTALPPSVHEFIKRRDLESIEEFWIAHLEVERPDVEMLLLLNNELLRIHAEKQAAPLLELLADALHERGDAPSRLAVLRRLVPLRPDDRALAAALDELWRSVERENTTVRLLLDHYDLPRHPDRAVAVREMESWLEFPIGQGVLAESRGVGRVRSLDPSRGVLVLDFEAERGVTMRLDAAKRLLTRLPEGHLLLRRFDDPALLKQEADAHPGEIAAALLRSWDRPASPLEIRHALRGVVADDRWAKWWASARKHPAVRPLPDDEKRFAYADPATRASREALRPIESLAGSELLDEARVRAKKKAALDDDLCAALVRQGQAAVASDPALAVEIAEFLGRVGSPHASHLSYSIASLLDEHDPLHLLPAVQDRAAREAALAALRETHEDWASVVSVLFLGEEDARALASYVRALSTYAPAEYRRLATQVLRSPRRYPRPFIWMARHAAQDPALEDLVGAGVLIAVLDGLAEEAFKPYRSHLKQLLDTRDLTATVYKNSGIEDARRIRTALERAAGLEEYRRTPLRDELLAHFPSLDVSETEWIYVTREAADRRREELEKLTKEDIPAVAAALGRAAALGDLKENHEYKAARERHETLSNRARAIAEELGRVRLIEPGRVDTTRVAIGTRVTLEAEDGTPRTLTLLGPWDTDVNRNVYSYLSPLGRALLGRVLGDVVVLPDGAYTIRAIDPAV
jgi:transcription elongation GreA/GreB family factor